MADELPYCGRYRGAWDLQVEALLARYPQAQEHRNGTRVTFLVPMTIPVTRYKTRREFVVRIEVPPDYPRFVPKAYLEGKVIGRRKHIYDDDSLCLFHPNDPPQERWLEEDGIVTIAVWAEEWIVAYDRWRWTGVWLGREAPHGPPKGWD
ncbi:MAG TPA: hypothetical protein VHN99_04760 [Deinococcales bacterium]|nr:hypothetical protein [Deinococcales bacterium]